MPAHDGGDNFCGPDVMRVYVEDILRNDDQVGQLVDLQRTFRFFAAAGKRRSQSVALNHLRHRQPLLRNKTGCRFSVRGLASYRGLHPFPRIESDDRPIAAEGQAASGIGDALPSPSAGGAIGAGIARPDVQRIGIRVSMERFMLAITPSLPNRGMSDWAMVSMCSMRGRRSPFL